jgi:Flp pilus assembly protein CpaB
MQLIPSGGVLAAAIGAGLVAAILVNIYASSIRSQYEYGSKSFYVLKDNVAAGNPIQKQNLDPVPIPKPLLPAFEKVAVTADARGDTIIGRKAPRDLKKGSFLWFSDFIDTGIAEEKNIPKGCEIITVRVDPNTSLGTQLQPGSYVNVRGLFDTSSDPKNPRYESLDVMKNVQVRSLGGVAGPPEKGHSYDNIQIVIPSAQARQMLQVQKMLQSGSFTLGEVGMPDTRAEPKIEKEVLDLMNRVRGAAAPGAGPGRGRATEPPPPSAESTAPPVPAIP